MQGVIRQLHGTDRLAQRRSDRLGSPSSKGTIPTCSRVSRQAEPIGLAKSILVGNPDKIEASAAKVGYTIQPGAIVATANEGESVRQAMDMVREGKADLLMKGKVTTAGLIRGIVDKERGLRTGSQLSQVIVFEAPGIGRLMLMTDAAINIAPTLAQKADITRNAIMVAHALGHPEAERGAADGARVRQPRDAGDGRCGRARGDECSAGRSPMRTSRAPSRSTCR